MMNHEPPTPPETKVSSAYFLWLACLLQLHGLHRLYNGKVFTGLLWLCTLGLFGVGQLVDLLLIPNMVDEHNTKLRARLGVSEVGIPLYQPVVASSVISSKYTRSQLMMKLLLAAERRGGKLSVTQAVMDTEASFAEVEATLREMLKTGYVAIDNHPDTGVVIYHFLELS
ncbi:TM2 domain-containing protein [Synechocystis sp. PCC 7509]|uniref:TM2 domain-containing protein n=1 Tax=Synechocystis sp. PCC 7509 TaxID=927677 RepID=UPI0002AC6F74|nr:NINE protein [Synechocystis sp. PCC 7509]